MGAMRPFLLTAVLAAAFAAAGPGLAQTSADLLARDQLRLDELRAQQQLQQQRSVAQHNELMALDARLRTEQQAARIEAERRPVRLPEPPYPGPPAMLDASRLPSIPDAALAASNRRVQEISQNRR